MLDLLDCLKTYISMGWAVLPCSNKTKAPLTPHGFKDASTDWKHVEAWHRQFPGCAWGTSTSAERAALDVDVRHNGHLHLEKLEAEFGKLPPSWKTKTGGGGFHHWLRCPPGTKCMSIAKSDTNPKADSITLKADGGMVIIPPSRIAIPEHEGRAYAWEVRPWEEQLAEAPAWLFRKPMTSKATATASPEADPWVVKEPCSDDLSSHPGSPEGERRKILCQLVGVHLARGDSEASIMALAKAWSEKCKPPFDEWKKHVEGLFRREVGKSKELFPSLPDAEEKKRVEEGLSAEKQMEAEAEEPASCSRSEQEAEQEASSEQEVNHEQEADNQQEAYPEPAFPTLPPEAYHGLFGEMLKAVEPETEADPAGILLGWLTCFGNIVGRGAWVEVGPRRHHPALYVGIVGKTSDAKGDSWAVSLYPFKQIEPNWASTCIANGVGSGEGLVERVANDLTMMDGNGKAQVIPGASDKRCLLRLSELSRCFKLSRRENATLSENLREGWDGEPIHVLNRKGNALDTSEYTFSLLGDITPGVLCKLMKGGTEALDGFANRYLWAWVRSRRSLPMGGNILVLKPFLERLRSGLEKAKQAAKVWFDADAQKRWEEVYPSLKVSGDDVPHTDRARPYALRMALLYALVEGSVVIRLEHLQAALALWSYCRASAKLIFGGQQTAEANDDAEPDPLWLRLLNAIMKAPGISRSGLREVAGHKEPVEEIEAALGYLERSGMAYRKQVKPKGRGAPAECWWVGPKPKNDNPSSSSSDDDGENLGREGSNSKEEDEPQDDETWGANSGREVNTAKEVFNSLPPYSKEENRETGRLITSLPPCSDNKKEEERKEGCHSSPISHVEITDISPPPNASLEAEAIPSTTGTEALGAKEEL